MIGDLRFGTTEDGAPEVQGRLLIGGVDIALVTTGWFFEEEARFLSDLNGGAPVPGTEAAELWQEAAEEAAAPREDEPASAGAAALDVEAYLRRVQPVPEDVRRFYVAADLAAAGSEAEGVPLTDLSAAVAAAVGVELPQLPVELSAAAALRLRYLAFEVDGHFDIVTARLGVALGGAGFEVVPDFLAVEGLRLDVSAERPLDPERASLGLVLRGTLAVGSARFKVRVEARDETLLRGGGAGPDEEMRAALVGAMAPMVPDDERGEGESDLPEALLGPGAFVGPEAMTARLVEAAEAAPEPSSFSDIVIEGHLAEPLPLAGFLQHFGWGDAGLGKAEITTAVVRYASETDEIVFALEVAGAMETDRRRGPILTLAESGLALERVALQVRGSPEGGGFFGEIAGDLEIGNARVSLAASISTVEGSLCFEGHWSAADGRVSDDRPMDVAELGSGGGPDPEDEIGADTLGDFLVRHFGVALGGPLSTLRAREIGVRLNTGDASFRFRFDGTMKVAAGGDRPIEGEVALELEIQKSQSGYGARFGGVLLVEAERGTFEFDLDVVHEDGATTLVAGLKAGDFLPDDGADDDSAMHLGPLAHELGFGDTGIAVEVALNEAVLVLRHEAGEGEKGGKSGALLGADVGLGLDLSRVHVGGLPLLDAGDGPPIPPLSLRLNVATVLGEVEPDTLVGAAETRGFTVAPGAPRDRLRISALLMSGDTPLRVEQEEPITLKPSDEGDQAPPARVALSDNATWFPIQRAFGPLTVRRVGLSVMQPEAGVTVKGLLDACVTAGPLTITLDGLWMSYVLGADAPTFGLDGLGIDFRSGEVEVAGALLHMPEGGFAGAITVHAGTFGLSGMGAFGIVPGTHEPSFLAGAVVNYPIGGPAFFFVEGLAGAFGYNRAIEMPGLRRVGDFPLIAMAGDAAKNGGSGTAVAPQAEKDLPSQIAEFLPPELGTHFGAVGVIFTSFKLIDSIALLFLRFGRHFEVGLLGRSTLCNPSPETNEPPIAFVRVLWEAEFKPDDGILSLRAEIDDRSYILDKRCHLGGGLAFVSWFEDQPSGAQAGDFVLSIGGYHPDGKRSYYPAVTPLTLNWEVNEHLTIKGSAYFALTGAAVMVGGFFQATWTATDFHASFSAKADFITAWRPHHYDARLSLSLHADVTIRAFGTHHVSFDASAQLHVWGPNFSGEAKGHVTVLGFDVPFSIAFGDSPRMAEALEWADFASEMLPKAVHGVRPEAGLRERRDGEPVFDRHEMAAVVETSVPFTDLVVDGKARLSASEGPAPRLGVGPVGLTSWSSTLMITITGPGTSDHFTVEPVRAPVPAALWAVPKVESKYGRTYIIPPKADDPTQVAGAMTGVRISPAAGNNTKPVPPAPPVDAEPISGTFALGSDLPAAGAPLASEARAQLLRSLGFSTHPLAQPGEAPVAEGVS